ncbi:MAG: hypothetical protein U9Q85_00610 [Patescibacteria group bacterium]|nr:hypothetical protein [Patescibacteria group bacterium]
MFLKLSKKILISLIIIIISFPVPAIALSPISDTISVSWPSYPSDHIFSFRLGEAIPPGGKIIIMPKSEDFSVIGAFDYEDFDLATSSTRNGIFTDRSLSNATSTVNDGVFMSISGAGTSTLEQIELVLNSSYGIATNTYVNLEIGLNAGFGATGTNQILNATTTGVQYIEVQTRDNKNKTLEKIDIALVMIEPVSLRGSAVRIRSNGKPDGVLTYGTTNTQMSLNTNYPASCRYSMTASTSYDLMTNDFSFTGAYFHSIIISGLNSGDSYIYYIRCQDLFAVNDTTDYLIQFEISGQEGEEGEEHGDPGPGGGGSGGGSGGGGGQDQGRDYSNYLPYPPLPGLPGVVLSGWGYPSREVTILKDGVDIGKAIANTGAEFGAFVEDLEQGVYTFSLWSSDADQNKSGTFSTTFWIDEGTQTTVSEIILSPTLNVASKEVALGQAVSLSGYSVPGKIIEAWLYPKDIPSPSEEEATVATTAVLSDGKYSLALSTSGLEQGEYYIKVKTVLETIGESDFSSVQAIAIGQALEEDGEICAGADLNGDGRVNLTDFSILLYHWGTADACADQNDDGDVNLTDFSIMMFYWTG